MAENVSKVVQPVLCLRAYISAHRLQLKEPINNSFVLASVFRNWHCVLLEDGTHVPKYAGEARLMFVLIATVHFVQSVVYASALHVSCNDYRMTAT